MNAPRGPDVSLRCVLVANRGEIARRIFRSARDRGMRTVAVFSADDAAAPFVAEADVAVRLPGSGPADTYLRADLIVAAAKRAGADCVHPGYGFLSENAAFARAVQDAGLVWVGPSPAAIEAMGSKLAAKALMAEAGVPTARSADVTGQTGAALVRAADNVGYPLLVKASYGGGGRGMRTVKEPGELEEAVASAGREAQAAFGDGTVFLERLVTPARHVEVQIFGDRSGRVVALHERECSIQRRHQKVIEEAPSPAVDPELRQRLCAAAVRAGEAIGYEGAGTVEFLLAADGAFFFLEMNTRLQVEHPVTEAVTGLDLVALQFTVAEGGALPPEACAARLVGAAVEARLYAEDPARGWLPQAGLLDAFEVSHGVEFAPDSTATQGVRVDSGVRAGERIGIAYDPMLAKVIAWAPDRVTASALLASTLRRAEISGVVTNRDLLVRVLESPAWKAGETDTGFIERLGLDALSAPLVEGAHVCEYAVAAALGQAALRRHTAGVLRGLPSGWRNNPSVSQHVAYLRTPGGAELVVQYLQTREGLNLSVDGGALAVESLETRVSGPDRVTVTVDADGLRSSYTVSVTHEETPAAAEPVAHVSVRGPAGQLSLREVPRFPDPVAAAAPGSLTAAMPGSVVRVLVREGDAVTAGQPIVVLEAMKMEHTVTAPTDGTIESVAVEVGVQVETGSLLAIVDQN